MGIVCDTATGLASVARVWQLLRFDISVSGKGGCGQFMKRPIRYYVSIDGNDLWSGRLPAPNTGRTDGPFATLARARDEIRILKKGPGGLASPVEVLIRGGTHALTEPLVLTPEDSGTAACPVTYAAYRREKPVISGGRAITGWTVEPDGTWSVGIPGVQAGQWCFRQLFVNGRRCTRPRHPEQGLLHLESTVNDGAQELHESPTPANYESFRFKPDDFPKDRSGVEDMEVVVLQLWTESRLRIRHIEDDVVWFTGKTWRPLKWSTGYYIDNVVPASLKPGQWRLDRRSAKLSYAPVRNETPARATVMAPVLERLMEIKGDPGAGRVVEHIRFAGLTFSHTSAPLPEAGHSMTQAEVGAGVAVLADGAHDFSFTNCGFLHLGGWAVEFRRGCRRVRIERNRFSDLGAGAIKIGEPAMAGSPALETAGNTISDNVISDGSLLYLGAAAVWIGHSSHNLVSHNDISGDFHWAVSAGWQWSYLPPSGARANIIEFNHCHHLGTGPLGAHGALYVLGVQPGTVIAGNLVHDVAGWPDVPGAASGAGIILDNGCVGILVENNITNRCAGGGFVINFNAIGNIIQNNIFAFGRHGQLNRYGDAAPVGEWMPNPILFQRNVILWEDGPLFHEKDWPNFGIVWDSNLYWNRRGPFKFMRYELDEWRAKRMDCHSLVADPLFTDPDAGDFTLKAGSPAGKIGFRPVDLSSVGPRQV